MPILVNLDNMVLRWQSNHNRRLTYKELAELAGISLPTLNRIKSNDISKADLGKINRLCKVLECEPGDLLKRVDTKVLLDGVESESKGFQQLIDDIKHSGEEE